MIRAIAALLAVLAILIGGATPVSAADRSPIVVGRGVAVACPADESVGYVLVPGTREIFNCPRSITLPDTSTEPAAAEDPTPALFFYVGLLAAWILAMCVFAGVARLIWGPDPDLAERRGDRWDRP